MNKASQTKVLNNAQTIEQHECFEDAGSRGVGYGNPIRKQSRASSKQNGTKWNKMEQNGTKWN